MFTNVMETPVAALVLASASIAFVATASATPTPAPSRDELKWIKRASNPDTNEY